MFFFLLILMNFFYSGTPATMKIASIELLPNQIVFVRHTLALLCFLPFFLMSSNKKIQRKDLFVIMTGSFFSFTFASLLQIVGMKYTLACDGSFIMAMEPLVIIALAYVFLKERLDGNMFLGLLLASLGFAILSSSSFHEKELLSNRLAGNLLFLLAVAGEASFPIFLKPLLKRYSPLVIAFYCLLFSSIYMSFFQSFETLRILPTLSLKTLGSLAYLGMGCSFMACFLWLVCLSKASASFVALSWFLQPLFGCLFACLFVGEKITPNVWIGGGFIFAALSLLTRKTTEVRQPKVQPSLHTKGQGGIVPHIQHRLKYLYSIPSGIKLPGRKTENTLPFSQRGFLFPRRLHIKNPQQMYH